ncbi:MAG: glycosyltransferase family 4 protein [Bacteroidales bacterium]|nr:glycosyltransferase family 4 protein [Bacteroidales bacterium]
MKLLCVLNSGYSRVVDRIYVNKHTGIFLKQLSQKSGNLSAFQQMVDDSRNSITDYNVLNDNYNIEYVKKTNIKLFTYVKIVFKSIFLILKSSHIYIFYPGVSPKIFSFFSIMLRKKIGIYVRGEDGIDSKLSRLIFSKAKFVITISDGFTENISVFNKNTFTVSPMIDFDVNDIIHDKNYSNKVIKKLLYVGRIEKAKGVFDLLEVASILSKNENFNFILDIVGDGEDLNHLNKAIKEYGLDNLINLHGNISDKNILKKLYIDADLFVFLSHHEGFPRVLYESMISGTPVATTYVGGIASFMKDCSIELPVSNPEIVAGQIIKFFDDYFKNIDIAKKGTLKIESFLNRNKCSHADQVINYFTEINNDK